MLTDRFLCFRFLIRGANPEKVVNALSRAHVPLRALHRRQDRGLLVQCRKHHAPLLLAQCERFSCRAEPLPPPPLSHFLQSILSRKTFLAGVLLFIILLYFSMQHIWRIDIVNAGPYEGDIRAYLVQSGVIPGIRKDQLSIHELTALLEWRYPQAVFVKTDIVGTSLRVDLARGIPTPEIETQGRTGDIIASQDGIVHSIVTFAGTPAVAPGDFVRKGQVLIRGEERISSESTQPVRARGQVNATLYAERTVTVSTQETVSTPTGTTFSRRILHLPFLSFTLDPQPTYISYDLHSASHVLGGAWIPLALTTETYEEISLSSVLRDETALCSEAASGAMNLLMQNLQTGDVVVDKWVDYSMIDVESYAARAVARFLRDIGRFSPHDTASGV